MALPPPHRGLVIPAGQQEDPNISDAVMGSNPITTETFLQAGRLLLMMER